MAKEIARFRAQRGQRTEFFCKLTVKLPLLQVCVGSFGPIIHGRLNSKTPAVPLPLCSFLSPQMLHHARASKQ